MKKYVVSIVSLFEMESQLSEQIANSESEALKNAITYWCRSKNIPIEWIDELPNNRRSIIDKMSEQDFLCNCILVSDLNLDFAYNQLVGWDVGEYSTLNDLILSMGLTYQEWNEMKKKYNIHFLSDADIESIDKITQSTS